MFGFNIVIYILYLHRDHISYGNIDISGKLIIFTDSKKVSRLFVDGDLSDFTLIGNFSHEWQMYFCFWQFSGLNH